MRKNRKSNRLVSGFISGLLAASLASAKELPCFIADNHAESFVWISRTLDLDQPHTLVLIDAHSDASAAERSDEIREQLRRVVSEDERVERVRAWRSSGRIQAYNWIEPMMPRPLAQVRWVAAPTMIKQRRSQLEAEAALQLDGRLEVEPRDAGSLQGRFTVHELSGLQVGKRESVILAIDLDFFAGMKPEQAERVFEHIWSSAMTWPGLKGVAFAISRPWLTDDAEADALLRMVLGAVARTRGATLEFDGRKDETPDTSRRAAEIKKARDEVPRWSWANASPPLKSQLAGWQGEGLWLVGFGEKSRLVPAPQIRPDAGEMDRDGVWRYPLADAPVLRTTMPSGSTGRVRWHVLEPAHQAVDLWPHTGLGKGFAQDPAAWVYERRRKLAVTEDYVLPPATWMPDEGGRVRLQAELETDQGWLPTAPIEIRLAAASGFRGALSECRGMPYVFGIAGVQEKGLGGVETGWGSDCSNLMIHAWRRQGHGLGWGDPQALRSQLKVLATKLDLQDRPKITPEAIEAGLVVDFGRHVAAVWEDRNPTGILDGNDLMFHHLGGLPEITSLEKLAEGRPNFSLLAARRLEPVRLRVAGDVVLAGDDLQIIEGFERGDADAFLVNLEGVPSMAPAADGLRYDFRFPQERLGMLRAAQVDVVSMANNHAGDGGHEGLREALSALAESGIAVVGAGLNQESACAPWSFEKGEAKLAIFGVSLIDSLTAGPTSPGVAKLPEHRQLLAAGFARARQAGERIVVMVHWGREYSDKVSDDQRQWARWLVNQGASVILGSHPHVIQRSEINAGCRSHYSLGNAVYPAKLKGLDSGVIMDLTLDTAYFGSTQMLRK